MAFDPNLSFQAGEGTYSINFKIEDQNGNHIWSGGTDDGSIGAYAISNGIGLTTATDVNGSTGISAEVGPKIDWTGATQYTYTSFDYISSRSGDPTNPTGIYQGGFVVIDVTGGDYPNDSNYWYGTLTATIPANSSPVQYAFKFKHTDGTLYPALVSGVINGTTYYKSETLPSIIGSSLNAQSYGGFLDMDPGDQVGMPIIFTVDLTGGGADPIVFSSLDTFSVQENQTSVGTVQASGGDGTTLTYSITGGADNTKFSINSSSGVLTFNSAPDFETPDSAASSNAYAIIVTATDGTTPVTQSITVNVTNVSESTTIVITTTTFTADENQTSVGTIGTTGGDGTAKTYSITGGADLSSFNIDSTGVLTFNSAPDYETKTSYTIIVKVADTTYTNVTATITVNIGNIQEGTGATLPTITGTASEGETLTANTTGITDPDNITGGFSYQWKNSSGATVIGTSSTYTVASTDVGTTITVTVTYQDGTGAQESRTSAGTDIAALDELTYFWTVYNDVSDNTAIHYGIYNTTKISGVQFTYDVSGSTPVADVSYSIVDNTNNNTMIHKKDWPIHIINNRTNTSSTADDGVANKAMVFAGAVNQSINGMNTGVFAIVQGNITLASIVAVVDNNSDLLATDQYALGEPANPPEITEPGGRKLGDINFDGAVDGTDEDILEAYLLNDTTTTFTVYDDGTTNNATTGKTAEDIITDMTEYDWQTYVDVNNNGIIDVGDLVRLLSKVANSTFSMTNGT